MGAYFGSCLCTVDFNGDGRTDLLVSAPTFVNDDDELPFDQGAVFIYLTVKSETVSIMDFFEKE